MGGLCRIERFDGQRFLHIQMSWEAFERGVSFGAGVMS